VPAHVCVCVCMCVCQESIGISGISCRQTSPVIPPSRRPLAAEGHNGDEVVLHRHRLLQTIAVAKRDTQTMMRPHRRSHRSFFIWETFFSLPPSLLLSSQQILRFWFLVPEITEKKKKKLLKAHVKFRSCSFVLFHLGRDVKPAS
jgi:hypothetical protein